MPRHRPSPGPRPAGALLGRHRRLGRRGDRQGHPGPGLTRPHVRRRGASSTGASAASRGAGAAGARAASRRRPARARRPGAAAPSWASTRGLTVAYQAFAFLAALLPWPSPARSAGRRASRCERRLPRFATVGEPLHLPPASSRPRRAPARRGLALLEELADPRPSFEEFAPAREPGEDAAQLVRPGGRLSAMGVAARAEPARRSVAEQAVPPLPRGRRGGRAASTLVPRRRGRLRFVGTTVARRDPLGLSRALRARSRPRHAAGPAAALPAAADRAAGRRRYQRGGIALATSVGDSEEFAALRDYRPGDPLKRMHWRAGPRRPAGGARVPGRVLRAPRARARHLRRRPPGDARLRGGGVGGGLVRLRGRHAGVAARPALRRPRGARVHRRAAASATSTGCSRSWPGCECARRSRSTLSPGSAGGPTPQGCLAVLLGLGRGAPGPHHRSRGARGATLVLVVGEPPAPASARPPGWGGRGPVHLAGGDRVAEGLAQL